MKKKLRKIWNKWLKISVPLNLASFYLAACCLDGENYTIPVVVMCINLLWLMLMVMANADD